MSSSPKLPKLPKWLSNKTLKLSYQHLRSMSSLSRRLSSLDSTAAAAATATVMADSPRGNEFFNKQEDDLKYVFDHFDTDGDGKISAFELRAYFASVGEYMSFEDAQGVIKELDTDGDDMLDFLDFLRLMRKNDDDEDEDLKKAFEMFELEKGDGCITPRGLQRMLNKLGDSKSLDECVVMIQAYDTDGNGVLDFHEFNQMMAV